MSFTHARTGWGSVLTGVEFLSMISLTLSPAFVYPSAELLRLWRLFCLNQAHTHTHTPTLTLCML